MSASTVPNHSTDDRWPFVSPRRRPTPVRSYRNFYSVVHLDVAGSATRDSRAQQRMRDDLYRLLAEVADDNDLDPEWLPLDDTGDGMKLVVPLDVI